MKNLKIVNRIIIENQLLDNCKWLTIDHDSSIAYTINKNFDLISINYNDHQVVKCCNFDDFIDRSCDEPLSMEYLLEDHLVFVATKSGKLLTYDTMNNVVNLVGSISDEIHSVSFSYDQELVVLLTTQILILMNKYFDVIVERELCTEETGTINFINVGWGSKKTQFHGSEGKESAKKQDEKVCKALEFDDGKSKVSWRGDGQYFVTSFIDEKLKCRKLRIWNRDAELQFNGELVNGLEHLVNWKPSGNLIASSSQSHNKHQIIFFEKNGLRHGEFLLPYTSGSFLIQQISWSSDSRVLLVLGDQITNDINRQILMLWSCNNYHWYEKQSLVFEEKRITQVEWDQNNHLVLHILFNNNEYVQFKWIWAVNDSQGLVSVVDGQKLKITNFVKSVIPPPFSTHEIEFGNRIFQVALSTSKEILIMLNDETILFAIDMIGKDSFKDCKTMKIDGIQNISNLVLNDNKLYGFMPIINSKSDELVCLELQKEHLSIDKILEIQQKATSLVCKYGYLLFTTENNQLWKYEINSKVLSEFLDFDGKQVIFSQTCYDIDLEMVDEKIYAIALSEKSTLYLNNKILSTSCSSYKIYDKRFLLFTTDNLLHCVKLDNQQNKFEESLRSTENGSQIVTVCDSKAKIIFQLPRGNLETIHPRSLLLDVVTKNLDNLQFDSAFELLRKYRVNLNFLCDYNFENFKNNIHLFIEQISKQSIQWLCLFLYELDYENVILKLYCKDFVSKQKLEVIQEKVDLICDLLRDSMMNIDMLAYINPILLTLIKKRIPEISKALHIVKSIENIKTRDEAIKFMLYTIDVNKLFDEALGTYDFDILLMVAEKSQKDPKEYMNLINDLRNIQSVDYRRYKIDLHLKRYNLALNHLSKCHLEEYFDEILDLIKKHSLYSEAILIFEDKECKYKNTIWKLYGDYLLSKKYFEEAAITYKRCQDYESAYKTYQLSGNWNGALHCATKCFHQIKLPEIYQNLAQHLKSKGKYNEASYIFENYLKDDKEALFVLIDGHEWEQILRMLNKIDENSYNNQLHFELKNHYEINIENVISNHMKLIEFTQRLSAVRENKFIDQSEENYYEAIDDSKSDIFSDTSSYTSKKSSNSLATRKSRSLSRSLKKQERKKYALREGSKDEDIQLIFAITEIIDFINNMQDENAILIKTLYDFGHIEEARNLQIEFGKAFDFVTEKIAQVWHDCDSENAKCERKVVAGKTICKFFISDPKLRNPPNIKNVNWKLSLIKK